MSVPRSISSGRKTSLITYTDTDPKKAQQVANTLGQVASEHVPNEITATVWRKARLPLTPASPNPLRNGLIALVASLALAISTHSLFTLGALPPRCGYVEVSR
jgi:capsular polysaccharide biosynthesis protein